MIQRTEEVSPWISIAKPPGYFLHLKTQIKINLGFQTEEEAKFAPCNHLSYKDIAEVQQQKTKKLFQKGIEDLSSSIPVGSENPNSHIKHHGKEIKSPSPQNRTSIAAETENPTSHHKLEQPDVPIINSEIEKKIDFVASDVDGHNDESEYGWFVFEDDFPDLFPHQKVTIKMKKCSMKNINFSEVKQRVSSYRNKRKTKRKIKKEEKKTVQTEDCNIQRVRSIFDGIWL